MGLFPPRHPKKEGRSWRVILRGVSEKRGEEALVRLFTEKFSVPGDDALKIVRSVPIILFGERTAREAEQMKLILNQLGARAETSDNPEDLKNFPRVVWPKRVEVEGLIPPPPAPTPEKPVPPPAPALDWKSKYDNLQKSYLDAIDRLEKKEVELKIVQDRAQKLEQEGKEADPKLSLLEAKVQAFTEEKEKLLRERDEMRTRREELEKGKDEALLSRQDSEKALEAKVQAFTEEKAKLLRERDEMRTRREELEEELLQLRDFKALLEMENPLLELEKTKAKLETRVNATTQETVELTSQLKFIEQLLAPHTPSAKAQK